MRANRPKIAPLGQSVSTKDLQRLLNSTEANNGAINRRDLTTFLLYPGGAPPELCRGLTMLPDFYEPMDVTEDPPMLVSEFVMSPKNTLWTLTSVASHPAYYDNKHDELTLPVLSNKVERITCLGIHEPLQTPVTAIRYRKLRSERGNVTYENDYDEIFFGQKSFVGQFITPALLPDGRVIFAMQVDRNSTECRMYTIDQFGGEPVNLGRTIPAFEQFIMFGGNIFVRHQMKDCNLVYNLTKDMEVDGSTTIKHMVQTGDALYCISTSGDLRRLNDRGTRLTSLRTLEIPNHPYLRGLTFLRDGRRCYIARTKDYMECWVIEGVWQNNFDLVSPIFGKPGYEYYYAYIAGRCQLMKMAITEFGV